VEILAKGASSSPINLAPSGSSPVVISYKSGDLYANDPLRASTCQVKYYYSGVGGLGNFANVDDTYWRVDVYMTVSTRKLIWTGFVSQDDSVEDLSPQPNEITLNCNDGIGMLKYSYFADASGVPYPGDSLHRMTISDIFKEILNDKTGLSLPVNIYCNLFENGMNDRSILATNEPFSQTKIDVRSFLLTANSTQDFASGVNAQIVTVQDKVQDNYTIMQNILDAWGCTLLQANGEWNIIRWHEAKQFNNAIPGTKYAPDFLSSTAVTFNLVKDITANYPRINLSQSRQLFRPNAYVRDTYMYEQTSNLIQNADMSNYGALLGTHTTGTGVNLLTFNDYAINDWYMNAYGSDPTNAFIRITLNYLGVETDRFIVVQNGSTYGGITAGVKPGYLSVPFLISQGDKGTLTFSYKTNSNLTGPGTLTWNFLIRNFANNVQAGLKNNFLWQYNSGTYADGHALGGFGYLVVNDMIDWQTISLDIGAIPFDGTAQLFLQQNNSSGAESHYKDFNLTIYTYIAGSIQVNGQYNQSTQANASKKNISKNVYFDDSPKVTIKGCMYLADGITKTSSWKRYPLTETQRFGFIQTVDWEYLSSAYRMKVDGTYRNLTDSSSDYMSALCMCNISALGAENYIFGQCSFDLKNAEFQGTLQELYKTGEYTVGYTFPGTSFTNNFSYLYARK
jgi:hypothetical protein